MKVLLDTSTFLWILIDAPALSMTARRLFAEPRNEIYLSAVSAWEIALKYSLGKLPLPTSPERYLPVQRDRHGIDSLEVDEPSTLQLHRLPRLHRDPFDRMLVCQAIEHGMALLSPDPLIAQYPVRHVW